MKKVKTNKLGRRILSIVLTVALMVGLMPGNTLTAYAKAVGIKNTPEIITSSSGVEMYYMHGYDTYIVDGTNPNTTAVYYFENNDANSGNRIYVNPNGAAGDDLSASWIWSNGSTYELSGDMNIEMTGGSVNSIATGFNIYGSGNDKTNVNINISGGSCGSVRKLTDEYSEKVWLFSEQKVPELQNLTGYVTKTDSGWVAHGDAIIPEGKTVTVGEGEVFRIESGATLTNNGTIVNNGTINTYALLNGTVTGNGTVVRNAICINDTASSITVYKDGEVYTAQTEVVDGKTYIYAPAGEIKVDMDGEVYYAKYSAEAGEFEPESEPKGVTDFTNMPTEIKANEPFTLSAGMVDEWFNTTVTYEISVDGGTDAVLDGNVLTAYGAGTIQVTVTAKDTYDYTFSKTYEIVVAYTPVSDIEIDENISVPVGDSINLSRYAVANADASYQTIEWSVVNANGTGATITDNLLTATAAGEATIRATVRNGNAYGEDYTKDFQVGFYAVEGISVNAGSITISKKDDNTITVTGGNVANGSKDYNKNEIIRIYGETSSNTITISEGTTVNLILTDVKIDVSGTEGATPLYVNSNAQLNLTLEGTNELKGGFNAAALGVPSGAELVIEESSTGTLEATGGHDAAGIGGGRNGGIGISSGTITINGGTITAICNSGWATGIGGGNGGSGGTTTINGGTITAISSKRYGAGIGGGTYGSGGTVIINGGTVTAEGYYGIGNGEFASGGTLKITGGNISGTYNITPTDGSNEVSCYTCKFIGDSEDMAGKTVTAITLENDGTYGLKDVVTFDGGSENEGYFNCYLPAGSKITSITVDGTTYICRGEDGTCYVDHYDWVDATCQKPEHCSVCELTRGDVIDHDWVDATCQKPKHCSVCELTMGDVIEHDYVGGFCTMCLGYNSDVFVIDSPEDLVAFANSVNAGNKSLGAVLDADIDMTGVAWTPICQTVSFHDAEATDTGYSGTFYGNGHTISNLTVTGISGGTYSYGLFGTVSGTVKNLGMVNYTYTMGSAADARAGSIAGQVLTGGTITNCYSVGHTVTTNSNIAGGISGCNYGGTISNCYALNGSVSGYSSGNSIRWGGVVGDCKKDDGAPDQAQTYGTVSNCYTDDTQVASTQNNSANITNCAVKDDAAFASGEIAYLLNGYSSEDVAWYQTLETDTYPVLNSEHGTVYYGYTTELPCEVSYTNDKNSLLDQQGEHDWNEGVCTKCDAACTHSYVANGECLICGFVTDLSVKLTNGGAFAEGEYTFADNIHTINTNKSVTISGTTTCERVFIAYGCDANIILAGVDINVSGIGYAYGIGIADNSTGDVTITLKEGTTNKISAGRRAAAVQKNVSNVASEEIGLLTIQGEGSLEANGGTDAAGIGGGYTHTSKITIAGGNITAKGPGAATGIGAGGFYKECSYITISGGTITAIGDNGIEYGIGYVISNGNSSNIFISGGSVNAIKGISIRPRVSAENSASVYLLEIDNPEGRDITINDKDYPDFHGDEKKIYAYLPAGTAGNPNIVKFSGNTVGAYYYDGGWKTVTCAGGHTASEDDGDCTTDITCEKCGHVITEGADAHNWENGDGECANTNCDIVCEHISSTDDGDCTTAVICSVCGKVITEAEAEHIDSNDDGWCDVCDSGVAPELEDGYYQIANAGNLSWFAKFVSNGEKDANAVLLADIDMTGVAWTPICQTVTYNTTTATDTGYTGTFDGKGHTISKITVTGISGGTYSYGLFGTVSGTVKNLGMVNYKYILGDASDARAGSIAGQVLTGGTIINCYSVGHTVTTNSKIAGGIAGCNYGGTISNCYAFNGSVSGYSTRWGGVVGDCKKDNTAPDLAQTYGTVSNCYTDDTRVASTQNNSANITNCAVKDDAAFASGEVAYLLNGSSSENVTWYQTLETDTYPVLDSEHGKVYSVFKCDGTTQVYRNVNENAPHTDNNSDGVCDVCGGNEHIHEWTYTASNNTITAVCGVADCPATGTNTIVISASDKNYDGTAVVATVENNVDTTDYSSSIVYKDNEGDVVDEAVNAGRYTANLTVGGVTAKVEFTIAPKPITVTAEDKSKTYTGNDPELTYAITEGNLVVGDALSGELSRATGENVGTYAITQGTLTNENNPNYDITFVEGTFKIEKAEATITVGETEYYKTFGDADFTLDITDDNPEANVTYSSNDENVVTVSNGTVTIKGAGTTTITVSMGASTNYSAAVDKIITVNVAKATYSVDTINKSYLYARSNADSINLAELLPEDCGTVDYASVTYNGALTFTSENTKPKVTNGILAYTLESGAADDTGNIIVDVETQNYEDITITVNVTLIDQIPVNVDGEVELNSNILTYGETLSGLTFKSVDFVDNAGNEVEGTLAWKEPSATPNAGTTSATWVFTPNNAEYASVEGTVAITVKKATPNVTGVPTVADRVYNPSVVLADSDLTGGTVKGVDGNSLAGSWSWQSTNVVPVVNNSGYIAVFTPTDSTNYETVTRTITVNVTKATPYVATKPTASALTYGQTLNQSVLSNGVIHYSETDSTVVAGNFAWEAGTVKPVVADSNVTQYDVVFTPTDAENYNKVETKITLTVNKAETTPNMPESTMSALYSQKTVGALELPEGWVWNEADSAKKLTVNVAVEATAIYNGSDKGNYEMESVTISITRQACDHEESDILYTGEGEKAPTCTVAGIGHTECTKCKEPMQTNVIVEATGHTGGTATCKNKAECSVCHEGYGELDKNNHAGETEVKDAKKATCAAEGYTGDTYCKDCGAKIATGTKIDKSTAHTWDNGVVTKEATATEKGEKTYTCSVCKTTKKEEIPALGAPKVGEEIASEDGSATYKVTEAGENGNSVTYEAPTDKNQATVVVPATVTINNITYNVTTISDTAFAGNKKLTSVTIGDNVTGFSAKTFKGCSNLKTLIIGNGVTSIPANAFKNFKKLTTVKMGTGVKTIGKNAFYGCKKLKNLTLGKNVVTIGDKAFYKCTSLTKLTIPSKVKTIGKSAFYGCKALKTITIGKSVTKIGSKAFYGCSKTKTLTIKSSKLTTKKIGSKAFTKTPKSMTVKVPKKKFKAYKSMFIKRGVNKKARFRKS